jgi:hypothetical protein
MGGIKMNYWALLSLISGGLVALAGVLAFGLLLRAEKYGWDE